MEYMDRNKCIFIHVPKTGGTSVLAALGKEERRDRMHLPWRIYYYEADKRKFRGYFSFTFVKDLWERVCSAYRYLKNGGNGNEGLPVATLVNEYQSFDEFIIRGLKSGAFRSHHRFLPQSFYLVGSTGELMVDFVGRNESMSKDFRLIAGKLKVDIGLPCSCGEGRR